MKLAVASGLIPTTSDQSQPALAVRAMVCSKFGDLPERRPPSGRRTHTWTSEAVRGQQLARGRPGRTVVRPGRRGSLRLPVDAP
jgi:hypothetical protein